MANRWSCIPQALERIKVCRAMLEEKLQAREIMYGTNTGIGEFSEMVLTDEQVQQFQRYLIYNHAAGIGEPAPIEYVRGGDGRADQRPRPRQFGLPPGDHPDPGGDAQQGGDAGGVPERLGGRLRRPGADGADGLLLMGEGEAFYQGERLPGQVAMERAGIPIPGLQARDGLAAINGSNLLTAMSALHLYDMNRWLKQAEIACAMSLEALLANMKPYDIRLHQLRGFSGAIRSAKAIMKCIEGSDLVTGKMKTKVQDAYSMRSSPQVIGAAHDAIAYARSQVEIELNGVGDNPIFLPEYQPDPDRGQLPGLAGLAADGYGRRGDHHGVRALRAAPEPPDQPGAERGAAGFPDQRRRDVLGHDAQPVHRRQPDRRAAHPVHARQHPVDPGCGRPGGFRLDGHEHRHQERPDPGQRLRRAGDRVHGRRPGAGFPRISHRGAACNAARQVIRKHVEHLDEDRPLYPDHNKMKELVRSCEILDEVEKVVGELG